VQQQLLDVVIVRRGRGRFAGRLPDGLEGLVAHNLITFKSHREALDSWAMKELVSHYVAYRKLVSPSPSQLLAEDQLRLYAITARYPHNLSGLVPWQRAQAGVYDCRWGTDTIRVVVAGELPREAHNAPLHLFSASQDLIQFGSSAYQRRSEETSLLLAQLFERIQTESFAMPFTMEDFKRQFMKEHLAQLTAEELLQALPPEKQEQLLQTLPSEQRLAGLSPEQIRQYLDRLSAERPAASRKSRRKK
jgi:hypothetical protein